MLTSALYALGSGVALLLLTESGLSGVFFIPAGITVAFLLRTEPRLWWLVLAGAGTAEIVMDLMWGYPGIEIAFYTAANVVEPLVGAAIVTRSITGFDLTRSRHLGWFVVGAVIAGPFVGAAIGSIGTQFYGDAIWGEVFTQWWLGDAVGVVVVGGLILSLGSAPDRRTLRSAPGVMLLVGTMLLTIGILARSDLRFLFLVLVGVIVAGAVFGSRAVAMSTVVTTITSALYLLWQGVALAQDLDPVAGLVVLKLQLGVFTLAGHVVAAVSAERDRAMHDRAEARLHAAELEIARKNEQEIAIRLQEALLPRVDIDHPGLEVAARYEAGSESLVAGGDWYDVFELPDGRIAMTVGDVVGHGLEATASMGRLRTAVAALSLHADHPGELLSYLHTVVEGRDGTPYATALYATLDPEHGLLHFASAGHPPMLMLTPDSDPRWLTGGLSPPMFESPRVPRSYNSLHLPPELTLILYSDGLVERRGESIQVGLDRLKTHAAGLRDAAPAVICDTLMSAMGVAEHRNDDVVVLAVRYRAAEHTA